MQLRTIWQNREQIIDVSRDEFNSVSLAVLIPGGEAARVTLSQVEALALARMIDEQVKDNRRS